MGTLEVFSVWFYTENTIVENSAHIHYGVDEVTSVLHAEGEGVDGEDHTKDPDCTMLPVPRLQCED